MLTGLTMNRVTMKVEKIKKRIAERLEKGLTTQEKVDELNSILDMEMLEYVRFQEVKTLAVADGTLTMEEGMVIYGFLGETPEHFNEQPIAVKTVLTMIFQELLGRLVRA